MTDPAAPPPAAGVAPPPAAAAAAAAATAAVPGDAADLAESSRQRRNRVKKLKAQYVAILELEQRAAAGQPLDAGQADKLARKAAVAEELAALGAELPPPPPPLPPQPSAGSGSRSAAFQAMEEDISQEEVAAALETLLIGGGGGGQRQRPEGPISKALAHQYDLLERNPGFSYFITLPAPLPDFGVQLEDTMGAVFFETMRPRAEAGQLRAVKVMYEQLLPTAQHAGIPPMQLRLQLLAEYGIDPVTEQVVPGSEQDRLAWLRNVVPEAEQRAAERQLSQADRFKSGRAGRMVSGTRGQRRGR